MKFFCITTSHRAAFRPQMEAHFADREVPVTFVQGVEGRKWGLDTVKSYEAGKRIPPGHIGLCLSHWMLWNWMCVEEMPEAVIMEDDVELGASFKERFASVMSGKPDATDLVFLGHVGTEGRIFGTPFNDHARATMPFGTHCYWLNLKAARHLRDTCQEARHNIDQAMWHLSLQTMDFTIATPSLAGQRSYTGEWVPTCL